MTAFSFEQARFNMIEQQIRPWDVLDQRVLDVMYETPREKFVPQDYRKLAFADTLIPLGQGQVMMSPNLEGRLLQALTLNPNDSVLEIGTGSGYLTALLARCAKCVDSVDIIEEFTGQAKTKLEALGISNVTLATGDALSGWNSQNYYDVIVITGSVPAIPETYLKQLEIGGCLFAIVGNSPVMQAQRVNCVKENEWYTEVLFETCFPPLIGASRLTQFVF